VTPFCAPAVTLATGAKAIVDDTFTKCFKSTPPELWNWNIYLFPLWLIGVGIRYLVLFPIRYAEQDPYNLI
jgi:glycerol-3-phosphate O-acyltransferase 3/4